MKKKNNSASRVTKSFLKKELQKFATKEDLQREVENLEARVQLMIDKLKGDIDEANKQYRDEFLIAIDPILKEVLVAREDRTITTHRLVELQEKVQDHEVRIKQME